MRKYGLMYMIPFHLELQECCSLRMFANISAAINHPDRLNFLKQEAGHEAFWSSMDTQEIAIQEDLVLDL